MAGGMTEVLMVGTVEGGIIGKADQGVALGWLIALVYQLLGM